MKLLKLLVFVLTLSAVTYVVSGSEMLNVALHVARPTNKPPIINAELREHEWKNAEKSTSYYVYMDMTGHRGKLKTETRILYDKNGIYLGIDNYCDNPSKLRRAITTNSHADIWRDDCAEIYFNALHKQLLLFLNN